VRGVALLEVFDDAQRVQVVIEPAAVASEAAIEGALAGMAEGRVTDVMHQGEGFGEVFVQVERAGDVPGDLRDLHGVGEARTEVVGGAGGKDLGFAGEAAEGAGLYDALAVALERRAMRVRGGGEGAREQMIVGVELGDGARILVGRHLALSLDEDVVGRVEPHLNDDGTVIEMGHPKVLAWWS